HCPRLSELYLRKNEIVDLSEILYLRRLRRMKVLWLADNPCADLPYYRQYILHHLPGLTKIDAEDVTEEERREAQMLDFAGLETNGGDGPAEDYAEEYDSAGRRRAGSEDMEALARAQAQEELRRVQSSPVDRLSASRPHERRPLGYRQEESPEHTGQGRAAYRSAPLREPLLEDEDLIEQRRVPQRRPTRPEQRGSRTDLPPTGMREAFRVLPGKLGGAGQPQWHAQARPTRTRSGLGRHAAAKRGAATAGPDLRSCLLCPLAFGARGLDTQLEKFFIRCT
ncbi:unnamed protein product, partial [Effrenium voratum]